MQLSVIIPTFNRADVLRRTLNLLSVQSLAKTEFEVIVVDDGSTDETPRLLEEWRIKNALNLKIHHQENSGQGVARNRGIEMARGEILVFLGDDMLPTPGLLEAHLKFHILHPEAEFVALGIVTWHPELRITRFMRWLETSGVQFKFFDLKRDAETDFFRFYTANISLKKKFLNSERFDPDFRGWGFEDAELGYRLAKKGMNLIYWPEAHVQHFHEISADSLAARQFSAGRNATLFQRKHPDAAILPRGVKLFLQIFLAYVFPFTYWSRAKRAFLAGIRKV